MDKPEEFWKTTPLSAMTDSQWESLCDGCGRCCLLKLEDVDQPERTPERFLYTAVSCKLLDCSTGQCSNYKDRLSHVPDCVVLNADILAEQKHWMPASCAYRLLAEGKDLPDWHPLKTQKTDSVRKAGISVAGWAVPEEQVPEDEDLVNFIIEPFHQQT